MELPVVSRRRALAGAAGLLVALVLGGRYVAGSEEPAARGPAAAIQPLAPAAAPKLLVHVVGAVRRPGLYELKDGSRVADAVDRAGGPTRKADLTGINLAAPVADGLQVVVPRRQAVAAAAAEGPGAAQGPVHLNTASLEELDALPGVGPVTAQKIIEYREAHGAFTSADDLDAVPGIGPARLEELRPLVAP